MKKWIIGAILSVAFACSIFVYREWEKTSFVDSLPTPPVVEQIVDIQTQTHRHSHPHETPVSATPANTVAAGSAPGAEETSGTIELMSEDVSKADPPLVDDERRTEDIEQTGAAWQTDDEHEHQSTRSPFAKKITRIEDMDPDEVADMMIIGLIRRFGDIPEVHTLTALTRKKLKNQPLTLDEHIDYTAAQYHLWPDPRTKKTLDIFLEKRATELPNSTKIVR